MPPKIDDKTAALLHRLGLNPVIPPVDSLSDGQKDFNSLDLPAAPSAHYFFRLWFHGNGEREIGAQLIPQREDHNYFSYRPFELAEFGGSERDLVQEFCEELEALLTHETRILQKRGWLFWHFRAEYREREKWKSAGSHSAFRLGRFKPPPIDGKRQAYLSGPIARVGP